MVEKNRDFKYEIINQIGIISTSASGWNVELNRVSWNGNEPKYDLRSWSPDHTKMGRGITFSEEEMKALASLLDREVEYLKED